MKKEIKSKTNFDKLSKEIYAFEKKAGFDRTPKTQLIKWLKEEIKNYEKAKSELIKRNKLMDIMVLVFQIARREGMSVDSAWKRWWWKSRKYLGKTK
jgi:hypothetical protein